MPKRRIAGSGRNGIVPRSPAERLHAKLTPAEGGCLVWTGALDRKGYARIAIGGHRNAMAHRVAYEAARGPIPHGLTIDHLCKNKACCNPDHLEVVTISENTKRKADPDACPNGHPVSAENTRYEQSGTRRCKVCERERSAMRRRAMKSADAQERSPGSLHSGGIDDDCPHAGTFRYCAECPVSPCPLGLGRGDNQ